MRTATYPHVESAKRRRWGRRLGPRAVLSSAVIALGCGSGERGSPAATGGSSVTTGGSGATSGGGATAVGGAPASGGATAGGKGGTLVGKGGTGAGTGGVSGGGNGATSGGPGAGGASTGGSGAGGASMGPASKGGTMTFHGIGAPGYWGRRILAAPGDPKCDVQGENVNAFGTQEYCCRTKHDVTSVPLAPFNEQMTLILRGPLHVEQLVIYQPGATDASDWVIRSRWDKLDASVKQDLIFDGPKDTKAWTGDVGDGCHWYATRAEPFACGPGSDPYCPTSGPDIHNLGWDGSKLLVLRASMPDATNPAYTVPPCSTKGIDDAPWVGWSASELMRDGAGKFHPCHCYANTQPSVGDGCGEINVWETVPENQVGYGNRTIMSSGLRSFQFGGLGGSVCGVQGCPHAAYPDDVDLVDGCKHVPLTAGAVLAPGASNGCPVWKRPTGERFFLALLDEKTSKIKIVLVAPSSLPAPLSPLLPSLPAAVPRAAIDALLGLSLPT